MLQQQIDNSNQKRQLGGDQDLQLAYDHNFQVQDKDLRDKILFSIQSLGSVRTVKQGNRLIDAYIKGPHCQQSIKDLVKFIRNDVPDNPKVKLILAGYNIVQSDLIELLLLQVQDKKLSFWIIALLALMTTKPSDELIQDDKNKLYKSLRQYKRSFIKHQCMTVLIIHLADYFKTQNKQKAHYQLLQFIVILLRNLLHVPDSATEQENLHSHFLTTLVRQQMFNPLLYLVQNQRGQVMNKIDIPLMEIFYYTFTCFDPELVFKTKKKEKTITQLNNIRRLTQGPTNNRHSRFMPNFIAQSQQGIKRITHRVSSGRQPQPIQNLRRMPVRTAELKKVQKIELDYFGQNFMELQYEVPNTDNGMLENKKVGAVVFELCGQFVQVQFPQLCELIFNQIFKQTAKITTENVIQYLLLCNWAIKMTRAKFLQQKAHAKNQAQRQQVQFDLGTIAHIMQNAHFELIYKTLFKQAMRQKKKQFKINTFNAGLKLFVNYLNVINDLSLSLRPSDRNNANVLMANMFRHDIARIFKIGFQLIQHEGILKTLINSVHKFYRLLSRYSNGKILTIQTNKLLRKKNKKKLRDDDDQEMRDFISSDSQDDDDGQRSYHEGEQMREKKEKKKKPQRQSRQEEQRQQPMFQQRKFNEISEFAIIAEYDIISKYLQFLKNDRILSNSDEFNESIFFYFQQISNLLKGDWLFFQAQTLLVFKQIISSDTSRKLKQKNNALYGPKITWVKKVCQQFIKLMQINRLALIESLFNYPNLSLKQKIMKNYDDGEYGGIVEVIQENMFDDKDEDQR